MCDDALQQRQLRIPRADKLHSYDISVLPSRIHCIMGECGLLERTLSFLLSSLSIAFSRGHDQKCRSHVTRPTAVNAVESDAVAGYPIG